MDIRIRRNTYFLAVATRNTPSAPNLPQPNPKWKREERP